MGRRQNEDSPSDESSVRMIHHHRVARAEKEAVDDRELAALSLIHQALGDPTRLKLLMALSGGEMCVCDLAAHLGLSQSAASHQLRRLKDLVLVKNRRAGQVVYYSLDDDHVAELIKIGLEHVRERK